VNRAAVLCQLNYFIWFQAAVSRLQRWLPEMGSFQWKFVEYKEQIGFVRAFSPWGRVKT
jgi:hypothetical protein